VTAQRPPRDRVARRVLSNHTRGRKDPLPYRAGARTGCARSRTERLLAGRVRSATACTAGLCCSAGVFFFHRLLYRSRVGACPDSRIANCSLRPSSREASRRRRSASDPGGVDLGEGAVVGAVRVGHHRFVVEPRPGDDDEFAQPHGCPPRVQGPRPRRPEYGAQPPVGLGLRRTRRMRPAGSASRNVGH
jgi:hypothetical protein